MKTGKGILEFVKGRCRYVGEFKFSFDGKLMMDTTMKGESIENVIEKIEKFLNTEINDNEYKTI